MKNGVYQIRHVESGKRYIGSASSKKGIDQRWAQHLRQLSDNSHHSRYLQRAWSKYRESAFVFEVLLYCDPGNCLMYEQVALDRFKPEYNMSPTAGSPLGVKHTSKARDNMSKAHRGIFDGDKNPFYGKRHSCITKQKISASRKGKANGEKHPSAKLRVGDVERIRYLLQKGIPQSKIAHQFDIAQTTVSAINNRKIWSHV